MSWVAIILAAVLAGLFVLEVQLAPTLPAEPDEPTVATLLAFGALNREWVLGAGEWYRMGSAVLLHASPQHLLFNDAALLAAGWLFETVLGRPWFLLAFCAGGFGGSLMSLAVDPANLTVVGASGAIMGLFAAGFLASFRMAGDAGGLVRIRALQILVPTLVPWLFGMTAANVDQAGHVGGVLAGALVGLLLWRCWPIASLRAPRSRLGLGLALLAGGLFLAAATTAALAWQRSPFRHLLPDDPDAATLADARQLVVRYPDDPRAWVERGRFLYDAQDYKTAEADFRTALHVARQRRPVFSAAYETALGGLVAVALSAEGRQDAAQAAARSACSATPGDIGHDLLDTLRKLGLCHD